MHLTSDRNSAGELSDRSLLWMVAATALCLGIAEAAFMMFARYGLGRYTHVNPQNIWLTPLWYLTAGLLLAGIVLLAWRSRSRARHVAALFMAAWLGGTGVLFLYGKIHRVAVLVLAAGIALQYARLVLRRPRFALAAARVLFIVPAAAVVMAFFALNGSGFLRERMNVAGASSVRLPNVLLIILDTVRAASMSMYGHERETSPRLAAFARRGVLFEEAYAVAPWTLPSHASMFTGLLPHELSTDWLAPLSAEPRVLAEVLGTSGYHTAGFAANMFYASEESGLSRGFQHYESYPLWSPAHFLMASSIARTLVASHRFKRSVGMDQAPGRRLAHHVTANFLDWLASTSDARPFFAFLNYFEAHAPYLPPPPFDTMFGPRLPGRDPLMREGRTFTARELQAEIDAYDGTIAYLDDHVGALLDTLQHRGVLENTLVIITSDHGEEFGEHDVFTHGNSLYREVLHVPLLMVLPGVTPENRRITRWVSLRDLPATILDVVGVDAALPGRSLARHWREGTVAADVDTLVASVSKAIGRPANYPVSKGDMTSVMTQPYRYIRNGDGVEELYDLSTDVAERRNLASDSAPPARSLRAYLDRLLRAAR